MRKLDKSLVLATAYEQWQNQITEGTDHPSYNSSGGKFYYDIIANLIWIQKGLCAYTEVMMQEYSKCGPDKWINGQFEKFDFAGELDHYNPSLKDKQGWLWDNFFLIDADTNSKKVKGSLKPIGLLKPDRSGFEPGYFLEYNLAEHIFIPNRLRTIHEQDLIWHDVNCLGLNWQPTVERRAKYLNEKINDVRFGAKTFEEISSQLYQFFTAFDLSKNYMNE